MVKLLTKAQVKDIVTRLKAAGYTVEHNASAGIFNCECEECGQVFWAMQKGSRNQPFICRLNPAVFQDRI